MIKNESSFIVIDRILEFFFQSKTTKRSLSIQLLFKNYQQNRQMTFNFIVELLGVL